MVSDPNNPYSPSQAKPVAADERTPPKSLWWVATGILGLIYGTALTLLCGVLAAIVMLQSPLRGWLDLGPMPELVPLAMLVFPLPGAIVGGVACGLLRGRRRWWSLGLACLAAVVSLYVWTHGRLYSTEAVTMLVAVVTTVAAGTLICNQLIALMLERRSIELSNHDRVSGPAPGLWLAIATSILVTLALILLAVGIFRPPSAAEGVGLYALGSAALLGTCTALSSLYLTIAYPHRWRAGILLLVGALLAAFGGIALLLYFT